MTLNNNYSFDLFTVGSSNQFAQAASLSVAKNPGCNYNPFVIYGDVGLGKTHLLHAIGLKVRSLHPDFKIICITAEDFMMDLIECIRWDKKQLFRDKYEDIDCLLIDDIQFISGKEMTQRELLHIFNFFLDRRKHIVVTSDIHPMCIPNLDSRLSSIFNKGLIADIQQPDDLETKMAIVKRTASEIGLTLSNDTAENIVANVETANEIQFALILYFIIIAQS
jgi:chromosomal replication initiator protein